MAWAVNDQGCCCGGECHKYMHCCINRVEAFWAVQSDLSVLIEEGIIFSAHIENLCQASAGDDWSTFTNGGNIWSKDPATALIGETSGIESLFNGCLMNMIVEPEDLVCNCDMDDNFKLVIDLFNCDDVDKTWYWNVGSTSLCFYVGNPYTDPNPQTKCCMIINGFDIDGGTIERDPMYWDGRLTTLNVPLEDHVILTVYFRYNETCAVCIDPGQFGGGNPSEDGVAVINNYGAGIEGTPRKECYVRVCDKVATGVAQTVYESFVDCEECNPAPSYKPRFDPRTQLCDNCYWSLVADAGWTAQAIADYGNDPTCHCGCPGCATRKTQVDCVPPNTLGPGLSGSGSNTICLSYDLTPAGGLVWHAIVPDGCVFTEQHFAIGTGAAGKYRGLCAQITMEEPWMTAAAVAEYEAWFDTLESCMTVNIAWHSETAVGGFSNMSMTIGNYTASGSVVVPGACQATQPIHWLTDVGCAKANPPQRQMPSIILPSDPGSGMTRWRPPREF